MKTIIGQPYVSTDNSHSISLEPGEENISVHLAGTLMPFEPPVLTKIISEPYMIMTPYGEKQFVNVEYEGKRYEVPL